MPQTEQPYRIVCGVDFVSASGEAVREAQRLAKRVASSELHFVHALDGHRDLDLKGSQRSDYAMSQLQDYVQSALFEVNISLRDLHAIFHVREEDPQTALIAVAREEQADVIIVGASDRGRLSKLWRRPGVRTFMQRAPVPVLVAHERDQAAFQESFRTSNSGSGVHVAVARRGPLSAAEGCMDSDSASSLHRLYEARSSQP